MTEEMKASKTESGNYPVTIDGKQYYAMPTTLEGALVGTYILFTVDLPYDEMHLALALDPTIKFASMGPNGVVGKQGVKIAIIPEMANDDPEVIEFFESSLGDPGTKTRLEFEIAVAGV